jgi:hypothetical protein
MQYVLDKKGKKTSVLVSYKAWEKLNADFAKLQSKLEILTGISDGLKELKAAKKGGKKLKNLSTALNEL